MSTTVPLVYPLVYQWENGRLEASFPAKDVLLFRISGTVPAGGEEHIVTVTDDAIRRIGKIHVFHDWANVASYSPAARKRLTAYVASIKQNLLSTHLLVQSRLVAMGVSVANLLLGGPFQVYAKRGEFEAALSALRR
jgi:hypothetical protein